jgi:polyisoprenoid-binding protein YceI
MSFYKTIAAAALTGFMFTTPANAAELSVPSGTYQLDKTHASVVWKVSHLGLSNYTARFTSIDATIELDAANVANSKVSVTIDPASVRTDYPFPEKENFDAKLAGEGWLNAAAFPEISFTSTNIEVTGDNTAKITGDLSFLGQTKPFTLDVTLNAATEHPMAKKPALGFSATGSLDRTEFGFNTLAGPIGTQVTVAVEAEFLAK